MFSIIEGKDGVAKRSSEIATTLAPLDDNLGNIAEGLHHVLRLTYVDKANGSSNDASRMGFALANEIAEFHQSRWGIAKGKEGIGMFLDGETDACLSAGNTLSLSHLSHAWIAQITLCLNTQALEGTLTDTTGYHRHIGNDSLQFTILHLIVKCLHSPLIGIKNVLHIEIGCGMDGMKQRPFMI